MITIEEIIDFIKITFNEKVVNPETDIVKDLKYYGDDLDSFLLAFSDKYNVNMDKYLWYFHSKEDGINLGAIFFKPPNKRVDRIPITPNTLLSIANLGFWDLDYPKITLPKRRYDMIVHNLFLLLILFVFIIVPLIKWILS